MPIKIENLIHIYNEKTEIETEAVRGVSISFNEPFFTAIIGKTGSGKSTLIQHINGLLKPNQGKIDADGFIISSNRKECSKHINNLRKNVGYLFQFSENQLFEETVLKDVMFAPLNFGFSKCEAEKISKEALLEVGIDYSYYERSPFELSGGEKRRIALAGVIAAKPKYLILDEPTAGLDQKGTDLIMKLFMSLFKNGVNIILISHDMDLVYKYCTNVVVMDNGQIVVEGNKFSVFKKDLTNYGIESPSIVKVIKLIEKHGINVCWEKALDLKSLISQVIARKQ